MKPITNILILAGGDGDRFWPLTGKILTKFLGKPYLAHLLDRLVPYGKNLFLIANTGNHGEIARLAGSRATVLVQDGSEDGMAGAVLAAKGRIAGDTLVVGNDFFDCEAVSALSQRMTKGHELVFLAKRMDRYFPGGYLTLDGDRVTGIVEKPGPENIPSPFVKMVADYFSDFESFVHTVEGIAGGQDDRYEQALSVMIRRGTSDFVQYSGEWLSLKYSWNALPLMRRFLSTVKPSIEPSARVASTALITGAVRIGKNVKVGDYAKISGPCHIGDDTVVADYALVRESDIGANCLIGSSSEVARSLIQDNVSLHRNYVGDSVISSHVLMGAGAVTANFRFDEGPIKSEIAGVRVDTGLTKLGAIIGGHTKIGVNSTILPGVKIGAGSLVWPAQTVVRDVADHSVFSSGTEKNKS